MMLQEIENKIETAMNGYLKEPKSNKTIEGSFDANRWLEVHPEMPPKLRHILLHYYQNYGRDFPWRKTTDPYQILVAEILLQKTAVKPVEQVWTAFLQQF